MRLIAVIQARLGSERLPSKVLMPLAGRPVLEHVVRRVQRSGAFDEVVVATTDNPRDDPLAEAAVSFGATVVRGSEEDVLSRFLLAAETTGADALARITADCPLVDPDILAAMAERFRAEPCDLFTNARKRTFPRGLDAEFVTVAALRMVAEQGREQRHREHVTLWLYENQDRIRIEDHIGEPDRSGWRWTLDTPEDFELLETIATALPDPVAADYPTLARLYADHPGWHAINAHIEQKKA